MPHPPPRERLRQGLVYHLSPRSSLVAHLRDDRYHPPSLDTEGFVHCTLEPARVLQVAADYFAGVDEPLLVLALDVGRLGAPTWLEAPAPLAGGRQHLEGAPRFPHVYGPIEVNAITSVGELTRAGTAFTWPTDTAPLAAFLPTRG